jgi:hypothetical protein
MFVLIVKGKMMGWYERKIILTGVRSAHNSINDQLDEVRWKYLAGEIQRIIDQPQYEALNITLYEMDD